MLRPAEMAMVTSWIHLTLVLDLWLTRAAEKELNNPLTEYLLSVIINDLLKIFYSMYCEWSVKNET